MSSKSAKLHPGFVSVVQAFAADKQVILPRDGKRFGSRALRVNGKIFAMMSASGQFVVKLPETRVKTLISSSDGAPFDPGHRRRMREWVCIKAPQESWVEYAREAYKFVSERLVRQHHGTTADAQSKKCTTTLREVL
jgi:hypothetical protein